MEMKQYIENSISKFMMVVKASEDTTKSTFGFMQETFERLIKQYVARKKTDRDMKFDEVFGELKSLKSQIKLSVDATKNNDQIVKESFK